MGTPGGCKDLYQMPLSRQESMISEYSACVSGCVAHMLTGNACAVMGTGKGPSLKTERVLEQALSVVDRLGFVGLAESWELSVCLFHTRFGGTCYPVEFHNVRPGENGGNSEVVKLVDNWDMGLDGAVYQAASSRFWQDIKNYGVTSSTCRLEICPD